jgi:hypothetical protein
VLLAQVAIATLTLADDTSPSSVEDHSAGVQLRKTEGGWKLLRDGQPYFIRGAGGDGSKELLARLGGNSIRTWSIDGLQEMEMGA